MDARERVFRDIEAYCRCCGTEKGCRHLPAEEAADLLRLLTQGRKTDA
jgi:hypothetical protein